MGGAAPLGLEPARGAERARGVAAQTQVQDGRAEAARAEAAWAVKAGEAAAAADAAAEAARRAGITALSNAVAFGLKRGRFDDVGRASCALAETYGVARPLD